VFGTDPENLLKVRTISQTFSVVFGSLHRLQTTAGKNLAVAKIGKVKSNIEYIYNVSRLPGQR